MPDGTPHGAAIIGTGFIGAVHLEALRRIGVPVRGVLGSSPDRGAERAAALGVPSYPTLDALLADGSVGVVHVTSPNRLHRGQVLACLAAGRHVVCEKPLGLTAAESAEMAQAASASGLIAAVCYNTRFYPLNQHARGAVLAGEVGPARLVSGTYLQDWLALPTDWNWRLDPAEGGALRAVGDIGTHWLDLTSFILGERPSAVLAELPTFIAERDKPTGPVETFTRSHGATERTPITTEDAGLILLRYPSGARGSLVVSQVSHGRKNAMRWEVAGARASLAWTSESPDHLWIGHRERPNGLLARDPSLLNDLGRAAASLPGGHVEGFADTFAALFRQVHADAARGRRDATSTWATFEDGHHSLLLCDAIQASARTGAWVEVA